MVAAFWGNSDMIAAFGCQSYMVVALWGLKFYGSGLFLGTKDIC